MKYVLWCFLFAIGCVSVVYGEEMPEKKSEKAFSHTWIEADYLYWWIKNSPASDVLITEGVLLSDQTPVLGGKSVHTGPRSGAKLSAGHTFDSRGVFGIEGGYLFLCNQSKIKSVKSSGKAGSPFLVLPFYNPTIPGEDATYIAQSVTLQDVPPFSGVATVKVANSMQDAELNASFTVVKNCHGLDFQVLGGFFWWNFNEKFTFSTSSPYIDVPGSVFKTEDHFRAHNNFYGGQVGFKGEYVWSRLSLSLKAQIALGGMNSHLNIQGQLITNDYDDNGPLQSFGAGYFALPTNEGHFSKTNFSIIPQASTQVGLRIIKGLHCKVGYTFLYATKVMWANNQIDDTINPTQAPAITGDTSTTVVGPKDPKVLYKTAQFWVQGITAGLEYQF